MHKEIPDSLILRRLADDSGLAIAVVDAAGQEIAVSNDNSICRSLNPEGRLVGQCAAFCGTALEESTEIGAAVSYTCHAGLECRATAMTAGGKPAVMIVGRTFVSTESYRKATTRAISGDWSAYPQPELFENILLAGSAAMLDKTLNQIENAASVITSLDNTKGEAAPADIEHSQMTPAVAVEQEAEDTDTPDAERIERRTEEASSWRSFFGSLLKNDYLKASDSILEFLAKQYGFSALIWLERSENRFENISTYGEMKNRKVRLGIAPGDERLIEASQNDRPLELGERAQGTVPESARTMNMFPIAVGGEISAAIAILDPITDEKVKAQIVRICHSIAPQLEILRLRSEVARGETLASAVRRFSESIKRIDADDFWLTLTQNAAEMLRSERASLLMYNDKSEEFEIKAIVGANFEPAAGEAVGERVARVVFAKNEAAVVSDVSKTGLPPSSAERGYRTASFLSSPIAIGGRTIGVMSFTDKASGLAFDRSSLDLFQAIAPQLAVAIDRATLKEKAGEFEQLSVTDALTGLLNRRYIEERLMEETKRSTRHGYPMSFMMLDVDNFKSYNDEFGHPAGDEALKLVGNVIRDTLRGADVAARFGGEEFSILLPQTTGDEAMTIAERIRHNIEHTKFPQRPVTASIGVANCSAELCISADLVSAADKALYEAKRNGRNRVLAFEELSQKKTE